MPCLSRGAWVKRPVLRWAKCHEKPSIRGTRCGRAPGGLRQQTDGPVTDPFCTLMSADCHELWLNHKSTVGEQTLARGALVLSLGYD